VGERGVCILRTVQTGVPPFSNLVDRVPPPPPPRTSVISQVSIMTITTILLRVLNNTFDSIITIIEAPVIVVASFRLVVTNTRPQKFHILTSIFVAV